MIGEFGTAFDYVEEIIIFKLLKVSQCSPRQVFAVDFHESGAELNKEECMIQWSPSLLLSVHSPPDEKKGQTQVYHRNRGLALFRSVPVQSRFRCELQFLFEAQHLCAVHAHLLLQLSFFPQFLDAFLFLSGFGGAPDEPFQVIAHCSDHKSHREGDIRSIGPQRCPHYRPHDCMQLWDPRCFKRGGEKRYVIGCLSLNLLTSNSAFSCCVLEQVCIILSSK